MTTLRIILAAALLSCALAWMVIDRQLTLDSSRVVSLRVVPVDPRDLFRGDYVVLNYDISRLDLASLGGTNAVASGQTVHVSLKRNGTTWSATALSLAPERADDTTISLKAQVASVEAPAGDGHQFITLIYGIESYFVPQGTGLAIDEAARKGTITVDAAIDASGRAAIKAIRQDGQPVHVEGIF